MRDIWDDEGMDEIPGPTREEINASHERRMLAREKWLEPTDIPSRWPSCRDEPDDEPEEEEFDSSMTEGDHP